jgi:hypothetical protein
MIKVGGVLEKIGSWEGNGANGNVESFVKWMILGLGKVFILVRKGL